MREQRTTALGESLLSLSLSLSTLAVGQTLRVVGNANRDGSTFNVIDRNACARARNWTLSNTPEVAKLSSDAMAPHGAVRATLAQGRYRADRALSGRGTLENACAVPQPRPVPTEGPVLQRFAASERNDENGEGCSEMHRRSPNRLQAVPRRNGLRQPVRRRRQRIRASRTECPAVTLCDRPTSLPISESAGFCRRVCSSHRSQ